MSDCEAKRVIFTEKKLPEFSSEPQSVSSERVDREEHRRLCQEQNEQALAEEAKAREADRQEKKRAVDFIAKIAGSGAVRLVSIVIVLFVGTYLISNLISLLQLMSDPNPFIRVLSALMCVALTIGILASIWYAFRVFRRLPKFEQHHCNSDGDSFETVEDLARNYLPKFPAETDELLSLDVEGISLSAHILGLRSYDWKKDPTGWLSRFKEFQKKQDEVAKKIIAKYSKAIGIQTGTCPWRAGDVLIVFVHTTLMTSAVARIYNRRLAKMTAFKYVIRWFGQLYISGRVQGLVDSGINSVADHIKSALSDGTVTDVAVNAGAKLTGVIAGKAAEAVINGAMAYRLGICAIKEFEAVKFTK